MRCPRCKSERIQRDYDDAVFFLRMVGMQKLLCNNCGLVFKAFDPLGSQKRAPSEKGNQKRGRNRRGAPRYYAHLPTAISLIDEKAKDGGKASYSQPSRGHCETISKSGMRLSLVGTRFTEAELSQSGRLLFVRVDLPEGPIEAVVSIVSSERGGESTKKRWTLGTKIQQMSDADRERLTGYLAKRAKDEPAVISD
jgi:transcription initiation factor TFIIIB Brf1 subunit/transcription initiation factor TFIIB